jgi:uncharacterized protein YjbJ (UPF0337 family)
MPHGRQPDHGVASGRGNKSPSFMTTKEMPGDWKRAKGKLKQKWEKLTDNDLKYTEGKHEVLLGRVQTATGETRDTVKKTIKKFSSGDGKNAEGADEKSIS